MSDGLRKVSKLGVADGAPIEAHHVSHIVDTLNGDAICDVKLVGSLTIDGSTYNSDTVYSNNFQASTALTVKGSTSNQLIFLDKNDSNNIRFRDAGGTVDRGYMGFNGDNLIINNQQGKGEVSIYNGSEALKVDTSQNITIPNGGLTVTTGIITGDGSGLTNLDLTGLDAQKLSNLPDSSVWSEDGTTATYVGTAVATNFQGNGSGLTNINGNNVSKVSNAVHADTAGTANSVDGENVNGTVANATNAANATYATTAGSANSVDGENVNGAVANATYATTAGSAPWNGTLEDSDPKIILNDSTYAEESISLVGNFPSTTTTYSANSWIEFKGRTKTIDQTGVKEEVSYSIYEPKFRMGIDTNGHFRIVKESDWTGCLRIERDSNKITIDQGLTVSAGGSNITGASSFTSTLSTGGKLTVSSGGAAISGASSFTSTLSTGGKLTVSSGGAAITGDTTITGNATITGHVTVSGGTRAFTSGNESDGNNRWPMLITKFGRWGWSATADVGLAGSKPANKDDSNFSGNADLACKDYIKAGGFFGSSDERLKEYLDVFIDGEALNTLNDITPKLFKWNEISHASGMTDFGFFAQEVEEVFPLAVVRSKTDKFEDQRSINPITMIALSYAAIKDLSKENNMLKDKNRELEDRLKLIEEKLGL